MNRWVRFSGIAGAVVLVFGLIGAIIVGAYDSPLVVGHLIVGGVCLIVWAIGAGSSGFASAGAVLKGRSARFGANVVAYGAVFLGLLIAINWLVHRNDRRFDFTEEGVYSLAPQSVAIVRDLKKPLKMVALVATDEPSRETRLRELLELYKSANTTRVTTEFFDPQSKPHLIQRYDMKPGNLLYLEYGESGESGISRINDSSEEGITNAILKLTRGEAKKVYVVQGHGEPDIAGGDPGGLKGFAEAVGDENLTLAPIVLGQHPKVPADAAAVVLVSPKKPLLAEERAALITYVEEGGRLLMFHDPRTTTDVATIAAHFKIEVGSDVIIDQVQRLFAAPTLGVQPIVTSYTPHPLTRSLTERDVTVYNLASSVKGSGQSDETTTWTDLAKTGLTAWAEKNLEQLFDVPEPSAVREPEDLAGPVSVAAAYERKLSPPKDPAAAVDSTEVSFEKTARVVVFGDSDWIVNANIAIYANRDFVLNALNWVIGEEGGVTIRPRQMRFSNAPIQSDTFIWLLVLSFLVPELILILGLVIWWRRRTANLA
jgi:ABC-type uncharacterized transport system involved in gliding motility auxiliary subunit